MPLGLCNALEFEFDSAGGIVQGQAQIPQLTLEPLIVRQRFQLAGFVGQSPDCSE